MYTHMLLYIALDTHMYTYIQNTYGQICVYIYIHMYI